jgi:hypothetical protein
MASFEETYRQQLIKRGILNPDGKPAPTKLHYHRAEDGDLTCPACGYTGPESDFTDDDQAGDGFRTSPETSETSDDDDDWNVGDQLTDTASQFAKIFGQRRAERFKATPNTNQK